MFAGLLILSCETQTKPTAEANSDVPLKGTWQLFSGTLIEKGDTTTTDYTKNTSFIKIINETHFAFLQHDLKKGKGIMDGKDGFHTHNCIASYMHTHFINSALSNRFAECCVRYSKK